MPTSRSETIYVDMQRMFAREITKKTTNWTLGDLIDAAGLPVDVKITESFNQTDEDDGYQSAMTRNSIIATLVELFDDQGRKIIEVKKTRDIPVPATTRQETYTHYELETTDVPTTETLGNSGTIDGRDAAVLQAG